MDVVREFQTLPLQIEAKKLRIFSQQASQFRNKTLERSVFRSNVSTSRSPSEVSEAHLHLNKDEARVVSVTSRFHSYRLGVREA